MVDVPNADCEVDEVIVLDEPIDGSLEDLVLFVPLESIVYGVAEKLLETIHLNGHQEGVEASGILVLDLLDGGDQANSVVVGSVLQLTDQKQVLE